MDIKLIRNGIIGSIIVVVLVFFVILMVQIYYKLDGFGGW